MYSFKTAVLYWLNAPRINVLIYFINGNIGFVCSEIRTPSQRKAIQASINSTLGLASEPGAGILQSLPQKNVSQPLPIRKNIFWGKK